MSYTSWDWLNGEPNGDTKKDVLVKEDVEDRIAINTNGKWSDRASKEKHYFFCTKKASPGIFSNYYFLKK